VRGRACDQARGDPGNNNGSTENNPENTHESPAMTWKDTGKTLKKARIILVPRGSKQINMDQ
jgi:hypothetical protein